MRKRNCVNQISSSHAPITCQISLKLVNGAGNVKLLENATLYFSAECKIECGKGKGGKEGKERRKKEGEERKERRGGRGGRGGRQVL